MLIWQFVSLAVGLEMLLPSPRTVALRLFALASTPGYWLAVGLTLSRIVFGFLLAFFAAAPMAAFAYRFTPVRVFIAPLIRAMKAAPVVSSIIICLMLLPSPWLSAVISFTMALPILYTAMLEGLCDVDGSVLDMAAVYGVPYRRRALFIFFPQTLPFLIAGTNLALGLCLKAGVAAELIGLSQGTVGEQMYRAKVFVDSAGVLAWTVTVIALSFCLEKAGASGLKLLLRLLERS
jgi:NitT/TauT family transport system permease protein